MPTIAPAQTNLRVMPTAAVPDAQLFTQVPNPAAGMQMFEQAAKLPLMFEQIKMEKLRMKSEKAKLDLAEAMANKQSETLEQDFQRQRVLADAQLAATQAELAQRQAQTDLTRQNIEDAKRLAEQERINNQLVSTGGTSNVLGDANISTPAAQPNQPLAEESGAAVGSGILKQPGKKYGDAVQGIASVAAAPTVAVNAPRDPVAARNARFAEETTKLPVMLPGQAPEQAEASIVEQEVKRQLPLKYGPTLRVSEVNKATQELRSNLQPKSGEYRFWVDGMPVKVRARMVGERPIAWEVGAKPVVDVETIHKENAAQKTMDEAWAKTAGDIPALNDATTREADVERLFSALKAVDDADSSKGILDSPLVQAVLPDKVLETLGSDLSKAKLLARTVIQKNLRATLGAQFAFKEGEQMLDRGFNTRLNELGSADFTREQLTDLAREIVVRHRRLEAATNYFEANNGTLYGFKPSQYAVPANDPLLQRLAAFEVKETAPKTGSGRGTPSPTVRAMIDVLAPPPGAKPSL